MSNATYTTVVTAHLPDAAGKSIYFAVNTDVALVNDTDEIFPYKALYVMVLDEDGAGSIELPTPDNTGVASFSWYVHLPRNNRYTVPIAFDADPQDLADLLAEMAVSMPAAASILSTKTDVVAGAVAGNLPQLLASGHLEDSLIAAADVLELLFPTACYCAMTIPVQIPPNQEVLMPMQVVGQTAAIHPGGISGTLTMPAHGLYDFQAAIYTDQVSLAGYYLDAKLRKNEEGDNTIVGWNRKDGLASASVVQVVPVYAPSVQMEIGHTIELYLSHNFTAPIMIYVQRLVVVRRGDYA